MGNLSMDESEWTTCPRLPRSRMKAAGVSARSKQRSVFRNRTKPSSDENRPRSKAALTFLDWTLGRSKGRRLSSVVAGVTLSLFGERETLGQQISNRWQQLTLRPPPESQTPTSSPG